MGHKAKRTGRFRSTFEASIAKDLKEKGEIVLYETTELCYTVPQSAHTYTPDFLLKNGIIIEAKGRLTMYDRKKMVRVVESNPELDIRFVFQRADNKIKRGSPTTYGGWCEKQNPPFKWAEGTVPQSWIDEK